MKNQYKQAAAASTVVPVLADLATFIGVPVTAPVKEAAKTKKQTVNLPETLWKQLIQHKLDTNENFQTVCVKALAEYLARQS